MLRKLLRKILDSDSTKDLVDDLEKLVEDLIEQYKPVKVILAGSLAEGRFVRGLSDIDLLVVVKRMEANMDRFTMYSVKDVDVEVTIVTIEELEEAIKLNKEFYVRALEKGVILYSSD